MTLPLPSSDNVLNIYLTLSQYPILGHRIRSRMRHELFKRGIISQDEFENEARQKAVESQEREGLQNPFGEESWFAGAHTFPRAYARGAGIAGNPLRFTG